MNGGSSVSVAVVADDNGITLFPFEGEAILVLEVNPLFPLVVSQLREVTKGQLDGSVLGLEFLDAGP